MRKYETVFISDPDIQDQTRTDLFDKVRNIIAKENGYLIDFDEAKNCLMKSRKNSVVIMSVSHMAVPANLLKSLKET